MSLPRDRLPQTKQVLLTLAEFFNHLGVVAGIAKDSAVAFDSLDPLSKSGSCQALGSWFCADDIFSSINEFYLGSVIWGVCKVSGYLVLHVLVRSVLKTRPV